MTKTIPLTRGYVALVDDEDYERIAGLKWCAKVKPRAVYAHRNIYVSGKRTTITMHRAVLGASRGVLIDHINGDGLDNRRCNLRLCTNSENMRNQRRACGTSRFKGVYRHANTGRWHASICINRKTIFLGAFHDEHSAALAYDASAIVHFGAFACTNASLGLFDAAA